MDEKLKERVVGAVVLVAAGIVFVPMILSGPEHPDTDPDTVSEAPPERQIEQDFTSRIVPLKTDRTLALSADDKAATSVPDPQPAVPPKWPAQKAPDPARAASKPSAKAPAGKSAPATAPAAPATRTVPPKKPAAGWVVQLGSFSNKRNALGLKDRLVKRGYSAFVETSTAAGAEVTRVYVGPEKSRDKAKARLPDLFKETKLKGIVTRYDG